MPAEILLELPSVLAPPPIFQIHDKTICVPQVQDDCPALFFALTNRRLFFIATKTSGVLLALAVVTSIFSPFRLEILPTFAVLFLGHTPACGAGESRQ